MRRLSVVSLPMNDLIIIWSCWCRLLHLGTIEWRVTLQLLNRRLTTRRIIKRRCDDDILYCVMRLANYELCFSSNSNRRTWVLENKKCDARVTRTASMKPLFYIYLLGFCREENKETKQGGDRIVGRTVAGGGGKTITHQGPSACLCLCLCLCLCRCHDAVPNHQIVFLVVVVVVVVVVVCLKEGYLFTSIVHPRLELSSLFFIF